MREKVKKDGARMWILLWCLGLAGQFCWNLENQWFNTFVYAKIGKDPSIITGMLICSAAATTFSTFFFGTWSDRKGNRRTFIGIGYILWGIFTIAFGLTEFIPKDLFSLAAVMVVLADTIMSFFGSMANDSCFNAWTNDIMHDGNRGQIGAALATQPVMGTLLGTIIGGYLVGDHDNYMRLFIVIGGIVILFGILSLVTMDKRDDVQPSVRGSFWKQFGSVFNFKKFFQMHELVALLFAMMFFAIGWNGCYAYMGNYLIYYLHFSPSQMGLIQAIPLIVAMLASIPVAKLINRNKHFGIGVVSIILAGTGMIMLVPIKPASVNTGTIWNWYLLLSVFILGVGYVAFLQMARVWAKQLFPKDSRGQFEGIWILFFVLIPMIGGALLSQSVLKTSGEMFRDVESGRMQYIPNGNIFLAGGIVILVSLIPLLFTRKYFNVRVKAAVSGTTAGDPAVAPVSEAEEIEEAGKVFDGTEVPESAEPADPGSAESGSPGENSGL